MKIHPITQEDILALSRFAHELDDLMEQFCSMRGQHAPYFSVADQWGHPDLPEYLPWMGPRYRFANYDVPVSIFRGEGIALFLLMRMLRAEIVVECFTGTGYASAWMAAGSSTSTVYTVDDYSEGKVGYEGRIRASKLHHDLGLSNTVLLQGTVGDLSAMLHEHEQLPSLYFSDGPRVDQIDLAPDVVVIRHDGLEGQAVGRSFQIRGGSNLSVMCPSVEERNILMVMMARYFPVEFCDA